MRTIFPIAVFVLSAFSLGGEELLPHADFSLVDGAWTLWPGNSKTKILQDEAVYHSGPRGARVLAVDANDRATLYTMCPVRGGRSYLLSFWYRVGDLAVSRNSATSVSVNFSKKGGANGSAGSLHFAWDPLAGGKEWKYFEKEMIAPPTAVRAQFCVTCDHAKGSFFLDDVHIVEIADVVSVKPAAHPPVLDGSLDDPCWHTAAVLRRFYLNTSACSPAWVQTVAYLTYDSTKLYIGFEAFEPVPDQLRAGVTTRDGPVFRDDCVEVFVTLPRGRGFQFAGNALGTQWDGERFLTVTDVPYTVDARWNGSWRLSADRTPKGWTAEFSIPFDTIGFQPAPEKRLLLNLARERRADGTETSQWNRSGDNFANSRKYAELVFGSDHAVLKRFSDVRRGDPFAVKRSTARFADLLADQPGHYLVGSWAHGNSPSAYPKAYLDKIPDRWIIQRNYNREIGEAGMFGAAFPWVCMPKNTPGGWEELRRRREKYGTRYWYAFTNSSYYRRAQEEGPRYAMPKTGKPARIDPVLRRISRAGNAAWFKTNGKQALPYLCLILGYDEPMGYARFEAFSRTLHADDGAVKVLDQVDAEIRKAFGYERYGLPDYFAPGDESPAAPFERIAFTRWWNAQLAAESRRDTALMHKLAPGVPYISSNFCFMYNLNYIDVALQAQYSDVVSADPYPTATLAYYGRERALYQTGFSTKYLADLAAGTRVCIMPQAFRYQGEAPTPDRVREWASQAVKNGADILFWYTSGPFRFTCPAAYREMLRVNHIVGGMNRLIFPATRTAIFVSTATLAANEDRAQHGWYTLYGILGEQVKTWFHFVSDTSLALGRQRLSDYRLVYATQLEFTDSATAERLAAFVEQGGTLVLFDPLAFRRNVDGAPLTAVRERLVGAEPGPPVVAAELRVGAPCFGWSSGTRLPLRAIRHQRRAGKVAAYAVTPPADARVCATYADGHPAAFTRRVGRGRVVYFAAQPFGDSGLAVSAGPWRTFFGTLAREAKERTDLGIWDFMIPARGDEISVKYAAPLE